MRKAVLSTLFSLAVLTSDAQNLVPNPSFEEYTTCPYGLNQIDYAVDWRNLSGSADLYNACDDDTMSVPYNVVGYQWPSDGDGYAGLGIGPGYYSKEHIQTELAVPLVPGVLTHVSMRVSPGGFGYPGWTSPIYASSHVGIHLTTVALEIPLVPAEFYFNEAVLFMEEILDDTATWTVLVGEFIPDSAYRFLQVGNFFADGNYDSSVLDPTADWVASYAFVDMVCMAQQPGVCDQPMSVGSFGRNALPRTVVFTTELGLDLGRWGIAGQVVRAVLFDGMGRSVAELDLSGATDIVHWPLTELAPGMYYLQIEQRDHSSLSVRSWKSTP